MRATPNTQGGTYVIADDRNLSLKDAAGRLGVAPLTLRRLAVHRRRLPYLKIGRKLLFRPKDLEAFELGCLMSEPRRPRAWAAGAEEGA